MDELPPRSKKGTEKIFSGARKGRNHPSNLREYVHKENWPTPTTQEILHKDKEQESWPTPTATERAGPNGQVELGNTVRKWGTPTSRDWKDGTSAGTVEENGLLSRQAPNSDIQSIPQDPKKQIDGHTCSVSCRRLNPHFAEWLMGLCLGWTSVSEPLETESFQAWQQSLSELLQKISD